MASYAPSLLHPANSTRIPFGRRTIPCVAPDVQTPFSSVSFEPCPELLSMSSMFKPPCLRVPNPDASSMTRILHKTFSVLHTLKEPSSLQPQKMNDIAPSTFLSLNSET